MQKIPVTTIGFQEMINELENLKTVERRKVIQAIATAREHGDLSENAEYSAAREKQSFIEGRIIELESKISCAEVIDPQKITSNIVQFSATVSIEDENEQKTTYQIVGEEEANIEKGKINFNSPLGKALLGKKQGDFFTVTTPGGKREYELLSICYQ